MTAIGRRTTRRPARIAPSWSSRGQDELNVLMAVAEHTLPRWDLSPFYPGLDSREFSNAHEGVGAGVARLIALYDEHDVRGGDPVELDKDMIAAFEAVMAET